MTLPAACGLDLPIALELPALGQAQRRLGDYLAAGGCPAELLFRVELVVEEAMMNVIRHAQGATAARLTARCDAGAALLTIEDDGAAFDPLAAPLRATAGAIAGTHDGGFGLHLIRRNVEAARYVRTRAGCNRLELDFAPRR